jgi:penicillin-binding protein 2
VENGGFGATFGVPIGSLVIEKYLTGQIRPERRYIQENMLNSSTRQFRAVKPRPKTN